MDLTDRTELSHLADLVSAARSAAPQVDWLLIGAMARDLLLHYSYGIRIFRATEDVDLALAVRDWEQYEAIRRRLLESGLFSMHAKPHRLKFRNEIRLDIVPFGSVEGSDRTIAWAPDGETRMTALGFIEASEHAQEIRLPRNIIVAVPNLAMLILLKIIAWSDRKHQRPGVDAADALLLLSSYLDCGNQERLFKDHADLVDDPIFDYELAGAIMAGRDLRSMLTSPQSSKHPALSALEEIVRPQIQAARPGIILQQVSANQVERFSQLLESFLRGISE